MLKQLWEEGVNDLFGLGMEGRGEGEGDRKRGTGREGEGKKGRTLKHHSILSKGSCSHYFDMRWQ